MKNLPLTLLTGVLFGGIFVLGFSLFRLQDQLHGIVSRLDALEATRSTTGGGPPATTARAMAVAPAAERPELVSARREPQVLGAAVAAAGPAAMQGAGTSAAPARPDKEQLLSTAKERHARVITELAEVGPGQLGLSAPETKGFREILDGMLKGMQAHLEPGPETLAARQHAMLDIKKKANAELLRLLGPERYKKFQAIPASRGVSDRVPVPPSEAAP